MKRWSMMGFVACLVLLSTAHAQQPAVMRAQPPEILYQSEEDWINSKPLKLSELRGQVVVLNFWTFG